MSCLKEKKINDDPTLKKNFFEKYSVMASVGNNFKQAQKDKSGDITFFVLIVIIGLKKDQKFCNWVKNLIKRIYSTVFI